MGASSSIFTERELQDYKDLTYFTKKEILHTFKKFQSLNPIELSKDKNARIPHSKIMQLPELKVNPFKDRICTVFSSVNDGTMGFEDFLDMMSIFSENAPRTVKIEYAFRIFDFDEDDMIGQEDLHELLSRLTDKKLTEAQLEQITEHILDEADLDEDKFLAYAEFEHAISKSPDFLNCFRIRL